MMNRVVVSVSLLVGLTTAASAGTAWTPDLGKAFRVDSPHTYHFKAQSPLTYDASRVAVQVTGDAASVWAALGVDPSLVEWLPVNGWHLVTLPAGQRTIDHVVAAT